MAGLFDSILIGFLVLAFVIIGGAVMIGDWENNYEDIAPLNNASDQFGDTYNTITEITDISEDMEDKVVDADISDEEGSISSISSMSRGAYSAIRLVPRTFTLFNAIAGNIGSMFGFTCQNDKYDSGNCWVIDIFMYMFIITIIFGIIYWARGFKVRG